MNLAGWIKTDKKNLIVFTVDTKNLWILTRLKA